MPVGRQCQCHEPCSLRVRDFLHCARPPLGGAYSQAFITLAARQSRQIQCERSGIDDPSQLSHFLSSISGVQGPGDGGVAPGINIPIDNIGHIGAMRTSVLEGFETKSSERVILHEHDAGVTCA